MVGGPLVIREVAGPYADPPVLWQDPESGERLIVLSTSVRDASGYKRGIWGINVTQSDDPLIVWDRTFPYWSQNKNWAVVSGSVLGTVNYDATTVKSVSLDVRNGNKRWEIDGQGGAGVPAVDIATGVVLLPNRIGSLMAVELDTGAEVWVTPSGSEGDRAYHIGTPSLDTLTGVALVINSLENTSVIALDVATGHIGWEIVMEGVSGYLYREAFAPVIDTRTTQPMMFWLDKNQIVALNLYSGSGGGGRGGHSSGEGGSDHRVLIGVVSGVAAFVCVFLCFGAATGYFVWSRGRRGGGGGEATPLVA